MTRALAIGDYALYRKLWALNWCCSNPKLERHSRDAMTQKSKRGKKKFKKRHTEGGRWERKVEKKERKESKLALQGKVLFLILISCFYFPFAIRL